MSRCVRARRAGGDADGSGRGIQLLVVLPLGSRDVTAVYERLATCTIERYLRIAIEGRQRDH